MLNSARVTGTLGIVISVAAAAFAQESASVRMTLEAAQAKALETSHRIAEGRAREEVAKAVIQGRAVADRPIVSAQGGYSRTNHVFEFVVPSSTGRFTLYPDVPDNFRARLDVQWPIYTGGRSDALERAARAEAAAVAAETDVARADLKLEVARGFWAVVTAKSAVGVLERAVARAQANVKDVRVRLDAGLVPPNEIASAEAQESRQRVLLIDARTQYELVLAELGYLVFDDPAQRIEPEAALDASATTLPEQASALAIARGSRRERTALERRIDAAGEQRAAAAAGRFPTISLAGGVDEAKPNPRIFPREDVWNYTWDAGVNVTISLWDGGRIKADVAQAAGQAEVTRQRLAEFDSRLAVEVRQRLLEIESGRSSVAAADDGVRAATEAQRVVAERYRAGVIPQIEVLDADLALLQAELDRTRALANVRLAEARLARALGR